MSVLEYELDKSLGASSAVMITIDCIYIALFETLKALYNSNIYSVSHSHIDCHFAALAPLANTSMFEMSFPRRATEEAHGVEVDRRASVSKRVTLSHTLKKGVVKTVVVRSEFIFEDKYAVKTKSGCFISF